MINRRRGRRQAGFSIIEFLIAMAIGLFIIGVAINILVYNKHAYRMISDSLDIQDSARFATRRIGDVFRMAGHRGGVVLANVNDVSTLTGDGVCQAKWLTNKFTSEPIRGYSGGTGIVDTGDCATLGITDANHVDASDILAVRFGEAINESSPDSSANQDRLFLYSVVSGNAVLGLGSQIATLLTNDKATAQPEKIYGRFIYPYYTDIYYVRPWTDVTTDQTPALVRLRMNGKTTVTEVMVSGVETMKVEFGIDSNDDHQVDQYRSPDNINDWSKVMTARLAIVARSMGRDPQIADTKTYVLLAGNNAYSYTPSSAVDHYARLMFEISIHLRNTMEIRQSSS
ncbi:PilW family protein [Thiorhodococcus fuscus]|uniref:PilW family protein n=1 Tax=Thiorhodococcus fuscus TaxID=527200 RepID=A0ABW4Y3Q4_9GAMM